MPLIVARVLGGAQDAARELGEPGEPEEEPDD